MHAVVIKTTGKHFLVHGGVSSDSHKQTPIDERTLAVISSHGMKKFSYLNGRKLNPLVVCIHLQSIMKQ